MPDDLADLIDSGLAALALPETTHQKAQLADYLALIERWNRVYNLTAVDQPSKMVPLHLMDALAIHPFVTGARILDVGSGAGLPGIPLSVFAPDKEFILLDSNGKKVRFMTQASIELGLPHVKAVHSRIEDFEGAFDHVICRAFTSLENFVDSCSRLVTPGGSLLAMKGPAVSEEFPDSVPGGCAVHPLTVPGLKAERSLVEIRP